MVLLQYKLYISKTPGENITFRYMQPRRSNRQPKPTAKYAAYKKTLVKRTGKPTAVLTKAVNQIVRRNEETKFIVDAPWKGSGTLAAFTDFTTAITGTGEIYSLIPRVSQGVDDHNRIGQEIRPVSLKAIMTASINTRMIASEYVNVHFFFLTCKGVKDQTHVNSVPIGRLLNQGDGTNTGFSGALYNSQLPVNKSDFTVIKHKVVRLYKTQDSPNAQAIGSGVLNTIGSGRLNHFQTIKVKIPTPKKLTYDVATSAIPTNYFPFVVCGWTFPDDNGGTVSSNTNDVRIQGQVQMYFKDA